ncbi:signal peptidase I [Anaerosacchariphilus polymeriproducens]|uniref:Signal peptidase I n=1 Tax=Anaerosacchariphilus polymeriproducens TaxID=1812858 RepID=A0A371ATL6_9FIRM|nr:signal peptidase I [Anaerosacchariphilus polymeriproducens]RDU22926.1 signal peptidase I [Anaerosacchariphilus polymeriproducens]
MSELKFYTKRKDENVSQLRSIIIWIFQIVFVILAAWALVYFMGGKTSVIGQSMNPTLKNGDSILINKFTYLISAPKRNDIIVFKPNGNENSHYYVKRVIGLPGETVQIKSGTVYIDGEKLNDKITSSIINEGIAEEEIKIKKDEYFVLGDNRNSSEDSRYANIGNINKSDIEGKAWFIKSPRENMGLLK